MNLRRWGVCGALLGAAAFVGCDEIALDDVQDERQDVIEEQQDVRQEEAELREAEQEALQDGTGPTLTDPDATTPFVPTDPLPDASEPTDDGLVPSRPAGEGTETLPPEDLPNEGNLDAGTPDNVNDAGGTAGEDDPNAVPTPSESGSVDQETTPEEPEPVPPE